MTVAIVTKENMISFLSTKDSDLVMHYVGRALVALFNRQVESEKADNTARIDNNVGFSKPDANEGSISAKYYLKHKKLEQWQLDKWIAKEFRGRPRIVKYSEQLNEIANAKAYRAAKMKRLG